MFQQLPLPDPTEMLHTLLSCGRLTPKFLAFLLERGVDVHKASDIRGYYPVQLALRYPTPWVEELVIWCSQGARWICVLRSSRQKT